MSATQPTAVSNSMSFESLTPTSFLKRSALVYADKTAVIDGNQRWTYSEFHARCTQLAGALRAQGVQAGERVAVLAPNTHMLLEAHYGIPLCGAVLVALNMRLTADDLAYIIEHSGARVLIHDHEFAETAQAIAAKVSVRLIAEDEYETLIAQTKTYEHPVSDERGLISINYTSGTTGKPKGVMYHHRGAYLQALAAAGRSALAG